MKSELEFPKPVIKDRIDLLNDYILGTLKNNNHFTLKHRVELAIKHNADFIGVTLDTICYIYGYWYCEDHGFTVPFKTNRGADVQCRGCYQRRYQRGYKSGVTNPVVRPYKKRKQ